MGGGGGRGGGGLRPPPPPPTHTHAAHKKQRAWLTCATPIAGWSHPGTAESSESCEGCAARGAWAGGQQRGGGCGGRGVEGTRAGACAALMLCGSWQPQGATLGRAEGAGARRRRAARCWPHPGGRPFMRPSAPPPSGAGWWWSSTRCRPLCSSVPREPLVRAPATVTGRILPWRTWVGLPSQAPMCRGVRRGSPLLKAVDSWSESVGVGTMLRALRWT